MIRARVNVYADDIIKIKTYLVISSSFSFERWYTENDVWEVYL